MAEFALPDWYAETVSTWTVTRARKFARQIEAKSGSPIETLVGASLLLASYETNFPLVLGENDGGYSLSQQVNIGAYRVDFLITGRDKKIIVECDGREFHHATREQIERDRARDAELRDQGYAVYRYPGTQIVNDLWHVVFDIMKLVDREDAFRWYRENLEFLE